MKRYQKVLLGFLIAALIIVGGIQLFFSFYVNEQLRVKVLDNFKKATGGAYKLKMGSVDLEIIGRQLFVKDIKIRPTSKKTATTVEATLEELELSGIGFLPLLLNKKLHLKKIELVNPALSITSPGKTSNTSRLKPDSLSRRLYQSILGVLEKATVSTVQINGLSLAYSRSDLPFQPYFQFDDSDIEISKITIDSTSLQKKQVLPFEHLYTTFREIRYQTPNGLYTLSVNTAKVSTLKQSLEIRSLHLAPKYEKGQFAKKVNHEIDRIDFTMDSLNWEGVDILKLFPGEELKTRNLVIIEPRLDIYRDMRLPSPVNISRRPLPQQMIRSIPFPLTIDTVTIAEGNVRYSERNPAADTAGYISFKNLQATFQNLSNIKDRDKDQHPALHAEADIMGKARLKADFVFPMNSSRQHIEGTLGPMNMDPLNEALVPLAFVRLEEGQILGMDFKMDLNATRSRGSVLFRYKNLEVSLLNKESKNEKEIVSFLANVLKIEADNTGDELRKGEIYFERNPKKSVFNYWWKSLLSGLKSSIGI